MDNDFAPDKNMSFWDHLEELRWVVFKCLGVLVAAMFIALAATTWIWSALQRPVQAMDVGIRIIEGGPVAAVITRLRLALLAGFVLSLPLILHFIWSFIAPGLKPHERRVAWIAVFAGSVFFAAGAGFGYTLMFFGLPALGRLALDGTEQVWTLNEYMKFSYRFILAFGLVFELPVALVSLAQLGIVKADAMAKFRPHAVVAIFLLAAVLTPPEPLTQIMLALPLLALYELSIVAARFVQNKGDD